MTISLALHSRAISRRSFLISAGGFGVAVAFVDLPGGALRVTAAPAFEDSFRPNAWVTIAADDIVSIMSPASEMGQGIMTTLPLLIAEEMDADWDRVRIIQAPSDAQTFGNPGFYGTQLTGGSASTRGYYALLRLIGAQTRQVILASAAGLLEVPPHELATEPGKVVHAPSGRALDFGAIAAKGALPDPLPQATEADLKPSKAWRYIGRRRRFSAEVSGSYRGLDIGPHHVLYAVDSGEMPDVIDRGAAASETVSECLDGNIETDLAAVFEAVSDRLSGVGDRYFHLLDSVPVDPGGQGFAGGPDDAQGDGWVFRRPFLVTDQHPHLMWQLRREFVESERGEQADDTVGHGPGGFGKAVELGPFRIGKLVETTARAHQKPLVLQPAQVGARNARRIEIARTRDAALAGDGERAILQRSLSRSCHVPYARQ